MLTGKDMKRLTKTSASEGNLQWIENGKKIAFLRYDKETGNNLRSSASMQTDLGETPV